MKYLFVHQNFPGQYLHILKHLAATGKHEILFLTEENESSMVGVRKMIYRMQREPSAGGHANSREFEQAMIRAEAVAAAAFGLRRLGFTPDVIIGHHGWGELLNLPDVWPDVPILGYFEFYYHTTGLDVDFDPEFPVHPALRPSIWARNAVNLLALALDEHGQTPTRFQQSTYPEWAREQIQVLPEGANLEACRPDPAARTEPLTVGEATIPPNAKLVTYVARNLEPYRGFHVFMRALPQLLRERPDLQVVLVGGDEVSYGARLSQGTWRQRLMFEVGGKLDQARVHFPGRIPYGQYPAPAATLGRARLSDLSVRRVLVAARSARDRVRHRRQRYRTGARVRHPSRQRPAHAVSRPRASGRHDFEPARGQAAAAADPAGGAPLRRAAPRYAGSPVAGPRR